MRTTTRKYDGWIDHNLRETIGERTGIVNSFYVESNYREAPDTLTTYCDTCDPEPIVPSALGRGIEAGGKGVETRQALHSSIGESLERYALRIPDEDALVEASYTELDADEEKTVVDFEYIDIWGRDEFPRFAEGYRELSRDTTMYWTTGRNLLTGEDVHVPAELVWFSGEPLDYEGYHCASTTNGVAAGPSPEFATLNGIYELVERDGLMKAWVRQETPPAVDLSEFPEVEQFVQDHIDVGPHVEIHPYVYDTEIGLPAVGAVATNGNNELPNFILGGAGDVDVREALKHAIAECGQGWTYVYTLAYDYGSDPEIGVEDNFEANVVYYAQPENFNEVSFLVDGDTERFADSYPVGVDDWSLERKLRFCLERFDESDVTPIAFDLTTRDLAEAGINVTRVWAPELVPITPPSTLPVDHPAFKDDQLTSKPHPSA